MGLLREVEKPRAAAPVFYKNARKVRKILMQERGKEGKDGEYLFMFFSVLLCPDGSAAGGAQGCLWDAEGASHGGGDVTWQ